MVSAPRRTVEIESLARFDDLVADGATRTRGWRVQDVDLAERTSVLLQLDGAGSLWLGCVIARVAADHLRDGGGLVFPTIPELPFDPYRAQLYTPDAIYAGLSAHAYDRTLDARIYAWSRCRDGDIQRVVAMALHDQSIEDALDEYVAGQSVVGVMGGHAVERGEPAYAESARVGAALASAGHVVASGGGPGAMEATNLGAYLHAFDSDALDSAIRILAKVPSFESSVTTWARAAFEVRRRWPDGSDSLGIPTWYYGHETSNAFANSIAKYFQNAVREDTLLRHCDAGLIFMPGAGGTVQEIFQSACENYYATRATVAPMVLVGASYWTSELPAWPLLTRLAGDRPMADHIHLVDDLGEVSSHFGVPPSVTARKTG
jgi:predicted Rossmann-fold nucleotide-binding protein